jgi:hypothetical protein
MSLWAALTTIGRDNTTILGIPITDQQPHLLSEPWRYNGRRPRLFLRGPTPNTACKVYTRSPIRNCHFLGKCTKCPKTSTFWGVFGQSRFVRTTGISVRAL